MQSRRESARFCSLVTVYSIQCLSALRPMGWGRCWPRSRGLLRYCVWPRLLRLREGIVRRQGHGAAGRSTARLPPDLGYRGPRMVRLTPVPGLTARLELHRRNVRGGNDEVAFDVAQGEHGHRRPQSSSASRFRAGASGFLNLSQSGERPAAIRKISLQRPRSTNGTPGSTFDKARGCRRHACDN